MPSAGKRAYVKLWLLKNKACLPRFGRGRFMSIYAFLLLSGLWHSFTTILSEHWQNHLNLHHLGISFAVSNLAVVKVFNKGWPFLWTGHMVENLCCWIATFALEHPEKALKQALTSQAWLVFWSLSPILSVIPSDQKSSTHTYLAIIHSFCNQVVLGK